MKGKHLNIFKAMANSPAGLAFYLGTAQALGKGQLNDKEREVVQLAIANANNCDYCAAAHTAIGKGAGLSEDRHARGSRRSGGRGAASGSARRRPTRQAR